MWTLNKILRGIALCGALLAEPALADSSRHLVLGVIATENPTDGVALIKHKGSGKTFAARVGQEIERDVVLTRVMQKHVWFQVKGRTVKVAVGDDTPSYDATGESVPTLSQGSGIERRGDKVVVSAAFRDHIVKQELSKVLMQAAAVPHYGANGRLMGFRLWNIDPGSVYEQAGFQNGDIITHINGTALEDVSMTIKMLHSLKSESQARVTLIRNGLEQNLDIEIR